MSIVFPEQCYCGALTWDFDGLRVCCFLEHCDYSPQAPLKNSIDFRAPRSRSDRDQEMMDQLKLELTRLRMRRILAEMT